MAKEKEQGDITLSLFYTVDFRIIIITCEYSTKVIGQFFFDKFTNLMPPHWIISPCHRAWPIFNSKDSKRENTWEYDIIPCSDSSLKVRI